MAKTATAKTTALTLREAAPLIAAAQPSTPSAVKSFFKGMLPFLPVLVSAALVNASAKTKAYLRQARDVLVAADLGDS